MDRTCTTTFGKHRTLIGLMAACALAVLAVTSLPANANAASRPGTFMVRIAGLPAGQNPRGVLAGPGVHQTLRASRATLRHARPGRYTLTLAPVTLTRGQGPVKAGATAYPIRRRVSVELRAGGATRITGKYGSIVNPGVVSPDLAVQTVGGEAASPSSLTVAGHPGLHVGQVLSLAPSARLPRGVLERIGAITFRHGATRLALFPVSIYAVVPVADFDVALQQTPVAGPASDGPRPGPVSASCDPNSPVYRRIQNLRFSGGWNTIRILGVDVKDGVHVAVDFDAEAGISDTAGVNLGIDCELDMAASGMVGPIPVTAGVFGELTASVTAGFAFDTHASVHVQASASTVGVPPTLLWKPDLSFSNPSVSFTVSHTASLSVTATIAAGVKAGLGNENIASATVKYGDDLTFTAQPGKCSWDVDFGAFSAEGKLLGWDIETPQTPPLYTRNLWHKPCAVDSSSPSPSPAPGR